MDLSYTSEPRAPIAGPPCAQAPAHTVLRPRRLRHHLGKITPPSSASRPRRDRAAGDNIYCSPRTVNSVVTSALDRLGQQLLLVLGRIAPRVHRLLNHSKQASTWRR